MDELSGGETARMALIRLMMKRYDLALLESGPKEQVLYTPREPETRQFLEFYGV